MEFILINYNVFFFFSWSWLVPFGTPSFLSPTPRRGCAHVNASPSPYTLSISCHQLHNVTLLLQHLYVRVCVHDFVSKLFFVSFFFLELGSISIDWFTIWCSPSIRSPTTTSSLNKTFFWTRTGIQSTTCANILIGQALDVRHCNRTRYYSSISLWLVAFQCDTNKRSRR